MKRHLPTLSILHYIYGAFICLTGLAMLVMVLMGLFLNSGWLATQGDEPPPPWLGSFFQILGWGLFLFVEAIGVLVILSGRWISRQRNRTGSLVVAGLCCLNFPFGMALGIFTFVVLLHQEVQDAYAGTHASLAA
ncbi:MAG: hypothetical protein H6591_09975 [Flavobacteriales bacterium]|nr:hypothetical protein [Flavobacteriales bacterium]